MSLAKRNEPASVPERIAGLRNLAYNLWWSWHPEAQALFQNMDPDLWERVYHNPVDFLVEVDEKTITAALTPDFVRTYDDVMTAFDAYMHPEQTWFSQTYPDRPDYTVAYFSPEFGLHESLPIYSGGLGILAGDHCKEASDLGLPLVGVGFLYPQGYFVQRITSDGTQEAIYTRMNFADVPALPAITPEGKPVLIRVELPGRTVFAMVWRVQVGRVPVFLLDTDIEPNALADRELSARLYGGDQEIRIAQEIVLGVGGVRALRAMGIRPDVWHMNEGHSAFLILERLRESMRGGMSPREAQEMVRSSTVFTTHTPVPAGNDAFPYDLVERYFWQQWIEFGMSREEFLEMARQDLPWGVRFSMTVLALRMSARRNGVSRIHGATSRRMWNFVWPDLQRDDVPIGSVTNGVHTSTWVAPEMAQLYNEYLGPDWVSRLDAPATWAPAATLPDQVLWKTRLELKQKLIAFMRQRVAEQRKRNGESQDRVEAARALLDPDALTIGFARRFATYKRATLLFRDVERFRRLVSQPGRPVQFIFAGKAHPNDEPGKNLIRDIVRLSNDPLLGAHVVFLEEYDMRVARSLVQGVDAWLNNPRKPNEASGTSGQKAALNGVPNASVLDGWWAEAFDGGNGWAIADSDDVNNPEAQDQADSEALYATFENGVIPLFYQRSLGAEDDHLPHGWLAVVKATIRTIPPVFNTRRMMKEYITQMYLPVTEASMP